MREYALETLADENAVLVIDETGFLKRGEASCGVARQLHRVRRVRSPTARCTVFASYVSGHGHALIDRALYLPKEWTDDPTRLKAARCPRMMWVLPPSLGAVVSARALAAKVPFSFVAADTVYGTGDIETSAPQGRQGLCAGRCGCKDRPQPPQASWPLVREGDGQHLHQTGPISNWPIWMCQQYDRILKGESDAPVVLSRNIGDSRFRLLLHVVFPRARPWRWRYRWRAMAGP